MTTQYVQFTDSTQTVICSVYACPQNATAHPNQGTVDSSDERFVTFMNPPAAPLRATPYQFRAGLLVAPAIAPATGTLRAQVEAAVAASNNQAIQDAYAYAQIFIETDPFITQMATSLGITAAQIHTLFESMQTLSP